MRKSFVFIMIIVMYILVLTGAFYSEIRPLADSIERLFDEQDRRINEELLQTR